MSLVKTWRLVRPRTLAQLFKGDVANRVAKDLPENIQLIIYG